MSMSYLWALLFLKWSVFPGLDRLAEIFLGSFKVYRHLRGGEWWHYCDNIGFEYYVYWSRQSPEGQPYFSSKIGHENWS